jgi:hypothetical protein
VCDGADLGLRNVTVVNQLWDRVAKGWTWEHRAGSPPLASCKKLVGVKVDPPQKVEAQELGQLEFQAVLVQFKAILDGQDWNEVWALGAKQHW